MASSSITGIAAPVAVQALFATISYRLEPQGRGSRFPIVMNRLYAGGLQEPEMLAAIAELDVIASELRAIPVDRAIANLENLAPFRARAPLVNDRAASLFDYFIALDQRPLVTALRAAIEYNRATSTPVKFDTPEVRRERRLLVLSGIVAVTLAGYYFAPSSGISNAFVLAGSVSIVAFFAWFRLRASAKSKPPAADIEMPLLLSAREIAEGTVVSITPPGLSKPVTVHVPAGHAEGTRLRLPGEGRPARNGHRGDLYLVLRGRT